jgi:hypothetical protein
VDTPGSGLHNIAYRHMQLVQNGQDDTRKTDPAATSIIGTLYAQSWTMHRHSTA